MTSSLYARGWHAATACVGAFALVLQLALVISGASILVSDNPPSLGQRLVRFVSYFTVQSNVLVLATSVTLLRDPSRDGRRWRVVRLNALSGIIVTAGVHWFFLRPILHLAGWSYATDKILHVVIPVMVLAGWLVFGPRPRLGWAVVGSSLIWPAAWLVYIMILGAVTHWYPYPFLDVAALGVGRVLLVSVGVALTLAAVSALLLVGDKRLPPTPSVEDVRS